AGIRDFRFHDLRHTFASQSVMAGVDLISVSRLLGHKDIKMTLRYAHLAPSHQVKAIDILDRALNGTAVSPSEEKPSIRQLTQKVHNFQNQGVAVNA
ncbi:MAG TPA: tyrosine-type recombinase/integrase, partial [Thermodesulfovibrionales bacterium]|nr:tyrosine-type recombinase/integrase [Thermodesulfovibrionales bacterium]